MRKGVKVWGLIVILVVIGSVLGGVVPAEDVSKDLTKSVADGEIKTGVNHTKTKSAVLHNYLKRRHFFPFLSIQDR
jgi:hypothetical protein